MKGFIKEILADSAKLVLVGDPEMMDLDQDSPKLMTPTVNLHPERRRPTEMEIDTSKSLRHSESPENQTKNDEEGSATKRKRQTVLDFSNGSLATKKPLMNPISRDDKRRKALAEVAAETILLLPGLLATRLDISTSGHLCQREKIDAKFCPRLPTIKVEVVNSDTIDAALNLQHQRSPNCTDKPVAILNMANAKTAGGGWKHGALAQEEALCYRTSLYNTLKHRYYPIPDDAAIYSPQVMVIRDSFLNGHDLLDFADPRKLEVISVISCAAVCQPSIKKDTNGVPTYALASDKRLMLEKMRVILRTAIRNRHKQIVLGALGCGAFGNPNVQVAAMWKQILQETEFQGGWWKDVVFAVLGGNGGAGDNFKVFHNALNGMTLQ